MPRKRSAQATSVRYGGVCIGFILIVSACFILNCVCQDDFPLELVGIWKTKDERYLDRYIEISDQWLVFGTGNDSPNMYNIDKFKKRSDGQVNEYTLFCHDTENTESRFILFIGNENNGLVLRLNNPKQVVWKRTVESE